MDSRLQIFIECSAAAWHVSPEQALELIRLSKQKSLRINPLKAKKTTLKDLRSYGIGVEQLRWCDDSYTVTKGYDNISSSQPFVDGACILQDAASFVPVLALSPKPGEDILDICAAPGGKTTHIAAITKNKASITANDTSRARFFRMRDMFERMNVKAETTLYDGRNLLRHFGDKRFDKILLDAPCSGEASIHPDIAKTYEQWSVAKIKRLSRLQEQLIVTAYDLLKPGGTLVYSTCTIAPEENEVVVNHLLKRRRALIEPVDIKIHDAKSGLTEWHGRQLNPELAKTYRLLPSVGHEAFYTAKITKPVHDIADDNMLMLA